MTGGCHEGCSCMLLELCRTWATWHDIREQHGSCKMAAVMSYWGRSGRAETRATGSRVMYPGSCVEERIGAVNGRGAVGR